ncbi:MAG: isopentenyl-diphosphate Delta-isomerase [Legionellales bacterium]|jgi:isopentenyl-diphosphate Delta-isomerase|nr:isopentenyl-diphosphate Delta-isomerase [Legionellales bacterium]
METSRCNKKTPITNKEVILVDKFDQIIATAEKIHAHKQGLLHRAFSIFIVNNKNEVLMQKRASSKYHCADLWTNTCCSHAQYGQKTIETAAQRLRHEVGLASSLRHAGSFIYKEKLNNGLYEHELDHVFVGEIDKIISPPNPSEVSEIKWVGLDKIKDEFIKEPNKFTPWLMPALNIAIKYLHFQPK